MSFDYSFRSFKNAFLNEKDIREILSTSSIDLEENRIVFRNFGNENRFSDLHYIAVCGNNDILFTNYPSTLSLLPKSADETSNINFYELI